MKRQAQSRVSVLLAIMAAGAFVSFAFGQPSTNAAPQSNFVGGEPSRPDSSDMRALRLRFEAGVPLELAQPCRLADPGCRGGPGPDAGARRGDHRDGARRACGLRAGGPRALARRVARRARRAAHRPRRRRRRADLLVRPRERGRVPGPVACRLASYIRSRHSPRRLTEPTVRAAVTLADTLPAVRWRPVWRGVAPKRLSSEFPAGADLRGGGPLRPARLRCQTGLITLATARPGRRVVSAGGPRPRPAHAATAWTWRWPFEHGSESLDAAGRSRRGRGQGWARTATGSAHCSPPDRGAHRRRGWATALRGISSL